MIPELLIAYLASLSPEEETRVLATTLGCDMGYGRCIRGVAENSTNLLGLVSRLEQRNIRLGLPSGSMEIEETFDRFIAVTGESWGNTLIRNQIRANQRARAFLTAEAV